MRFDLGRAALHAIVVTAVVSLITLILATARPARVTTHAAAAPAEARA